MKKILFLAAITALVMACSTTRRAMTDTENPSGQTVETEDQHDTIDRHRD